MTPETTATSEKTMTCRQLTETFLRLYTDLPETPDRPRPADRTLATNWALEGLDYQLVKGALALAAARRLYRSPDLPPLQPIRSLHYFIHVIEEVKREPLDPEYLEYLEIKLRRACP
jgi:hypothetical protein